MNLSGELVFVCVSFVLIAVNVSGQRFDPARDNQFHLFTRLNPSVSQPLVLGLPGVLATSNYDSSKKTVVTHHGRTESVTSSSNTVLISALLAGGDVNVIAVDWSIGAIMDQPSEELLDNTHRSGQFVASFLLWVVESTGHTLDDFIILGFSIGAHHAANTARYLGGRASYLVGLDPAAYADYEHAFRSTDAVYTEIINTDIDERGLQHLAMNNFFPNGGSDMPGCGGVPVCSHGRSFHYFAESVVSGGFTAQECESADEAMNQSCGLSGSLNMGGWVPKPGVIGTGYYHLTTNDFTPFSQG